LGVNMQVGKSHRSINVK